MGHIEYLYQARSLGDMLMVIVNNDTQVKLKGSRSFMSQQDRKEIVSALKWVDGTILSRSSDGSVCADLEYLRTAFPTDELIFAKGGDRFAGEIPETTTCARLDIKLVDGLGDKIRASSQILREWEEGK